MRHEVIWTSIWICGWLSMVYGCSCPEWPVALCDNYETSSNVYAARVINATCSCISEGYHDVNSGYAFHGNTTNISCVTAAIDSGELVSETVVRTEVRTTCDVYDNYNILPCKNILINFAAADCPYEGQVYMDCAPLCPTTCSNKDVASRCPRVCVRGCGCPEGMVIDEEQRRCVMPSQCPNKACPLVGQVATLCNSSLEFCPQDCFRPGNDDNCVQLCDGCACPPPTIADYITGECVQPEQCTACPIEGQVYTECGSWCLQTCDNYNDGTGCIDACWQGCECPFGMVIDVERRRCVEPTQCNIQRTSKDGQYGCIPRFVCPYNEDEDNIHYPCQYTVEVTRTFKGSLEVGDVIVNFGPDLLTSCGNPANILSINTTYIVGVGGPCSLYNDWTPYSSYSSADLELLANNCTESSAAIVPLSSMVTLLLLAVLSYCGKISLL